MGSSGKEKLSLRQSILWNAWGCTFYLAVQWLLTIIVTRTLGYEDAGVFSLAMSITNIFYALSTYGMKNYQIADLGGKFSTGNYVTSRFVTCGIATIGCIVFTLVNGYTFYQRTCIIIYMVFKLSESFFDVLLGVYQKHWRMDLMGKSMTMRACLMLVSFSSMILIMHNLAVAIMAMAVLTFMVVIFYDVNKVKRLEVIRCFENVSKVGSLLRECFPLAVYMLLSTSIGSIPRYFLEIFRGSEELGIYASVASPTLIIQMSASYLFNPMITIFSESFNSKDKTRFMKALLDCVKGSVLISVLAILGGKIFGRLGLRILFGESILAYEFLLIPLIVCTILTAEIWLFSSVLTVVRNFKGLIVGNGCAVVLSVIGSMVLIPKYGMQGTTYALIIGNFAGIALLVKYMVHDIKTKF